MGKHFIGYIIVLAAGLAIGLGLNFTQSAPEPLTKDVDNPNQRQAKTKNQAPVTTRPAVQVEGTDENQPQPTLTQLIDNPVLFERLTGAYTLAQQADVETLSRLLDELTEQESDYNMTLMARVFLVRWAQIDPQGAIEKYYQLYPEPQIARKDLVYGLYHQWAMQDMNALLTFIANTTPQSQRGKVYQYLVDDEHFSDNQALMDQAGQYSPYLKAFVVKKHTEDLPFAQQFEALLTLGLEDRELSREVYPLLLQWAKADPQQALQRLADMEQNNNRVKRWIDIVLREWSKTAPEDALIVALALPDGQQYGDTVLRSISYDDPQKAMSLLATHTEKLSSKLYQSIFSTWSNKDPKAAMAYIDQMSPMQKQKILKNSRFLWSLARGSATDAFDFALRNDMLKSRTNLFTVANALVEQDLEKAQAYWANLPEGDVRNVLASHIVKNISKSDIDSALRWLQDNNINDRANRQARAMLYTQWVKTEPYAAAQDAISSDNQQDQKYLTLSLLSSWYRQDKDEAVKWVTSLIDKSLKDTALASLAQLSYRDDLDLSRRLANQISDEELRKRTLEMLN